VGRFVEWAQFNESHHLQALFLVRLVALGPPYRLPPTTHASPCICLR